MTKETGKAVAKTGGNANAIAEVAPDFMAGIGGAATNIDQNDLELPRVKLIQATSPEVDDGVRPGRFYHNVAELDLGDTLTIVPVYLSKSFMLWRPQDDNGGGLLARAMDAVNWTPAQGEFKVKINKATKEVTWTLAPTVKESGLDQWGTEDPDNPQSPPAATKMINAICYSPDHPELGLFAFTFQRGSLKVGTRFVTKVSMSRIPSFGQVYEMSSEKARNAASQEYWAPTVKGKGFVGDQELFTYLQGLNEVVGKSSVSILGDEELQAEGAREDADDEKSAETAARI